MSRTANRTRTTGETDVSVSLDLDGTGKATCETGVGFLDHMLDLLARHSLIDLEIRARGDLQVDAHHTVEDVGLTLGQAMHEALGDRAGISRYGEARLPMDEACVAVAIDLSGRAYFRAHLPFEAEKIGDFDTQLVAEFLRALATEVRMALDVDVIAGGNAHHVAEAVFKGVARALRRAVEPDGRRSGIPSTKGSLGG
jgi:imidazoleglycerol-phosphate dehydratase